MDDEARRARDAWVACRCQLGEPGAFDTLVSEMERPLFYYVMKLLGDEDAALDVLQEVWVKVFRGISALRVPEALRPWLYRVARGTALNHVRDDDARSWAEEPIDEAAGDQCLLTAIVLMVGAGVWYDGQLKQVWLGVTACFVLVVASGIQINHLINWSRLHTEKDLKAIEMRLMEIQQRLDKA